MAYQKKTKGTTDKKITDFYTSANKRPETSPISEMKKSLKKTRLTTPSPKKSGFTYKGFLFILCLEPKLPKSQRKEKKGIKMNILKV